MSMSILRSARITLLGEIVSKFPLLAFELLIARTLSIPSYAQWSAFQIILRAIPFAHLGVLSDYNKQYPRLLGRDQKRAASALDYSVLRAIALISVVIWAGLASTALLLMLIGNKAAALIILVISFTIVAAQLYVFFMAKYRNDYQFGVSIKGLIIYAFSVLVAGVILLPSLGVLGGFIAYFAGYSIAAVYYLSHYKKAKAKRVIHISQLMRRGWSPFLLTISHFAFQMSDRMAFTTIGNDHLLAGYGFSFLFIQVLFLLVGSLGRVVAPYALRSFASGSVDTAFNYSTTFSLFVLASSMLAVWGILLAGGWFINIAFPSYIYVLDALPIYVAAGGALAAAQTLFTPLMGLNLERFAVSINLTLGVLLVSLVLVFSIFFGGADLFYFSLISLVVSILYFSSFIIFLCLRYPAHRSQKKKFIQRVMSLALLNAAISLVIVALK